MPATLITVAAITLAGLAVSEGYRSRAYDDGAGVQTVGFGSTRHPDGTPVKPGDTVTPERAVVMLARDADRIWREAADCIGEVPLYPHEAAAFQSLAYNIGAAAFCRSTIVKKLKANPPDYAGACREILRWTRAGGRELPGLKKRREAEYRQCVGGTKNE
ncbi:lysozyme [Pelomicrobium methylotrophicum]